MSNNLEKVQEGESEELGVGSGDDAHREEGDIDKEAEGHQSPKDIDEEVTEEIKWPLVCVDRMCWRMDWSVLTLLGAKCGATQIAQM